jgi:DNA mismatch endonuclease, patch repair protein
MDNLSAEQRRKNMQNIRGAGTGIEMRIVSILKRTDLRFVTNDHTLFGKPDIVFRRARVAVFLDSCFWHLCPYHKTMPKSNRKYWIAKLEGNRRRDRIVDLKLRHSSWTVIRFWEHSIRQRPDHCVQRILRTVAMKNLSLFTEAHEVVSPCSDKK